MGDPQTGVPGAIVISGASSGIGEATALRLDQAGLHVFAGVRRKEDEEALRRQGSERLTPVYLDVTDTASICAAVDVISAAVGQSGLAGLVNNAGVVVAGPLEFLSLSEIRHQFEVNVIGHLAVLQAFLPLLRRGKGRIVMVGSTGGRVALPFLAPYSASKFALEAVADSLRNELQPWNIPVSLIEPNFIATAIWRKSRVRADASISDFPPEANRLYRKQIAVMRRLSTRVGEMATPAEEVAEVIFEALTIAKPKPRYVAGRGARVVTTLFARLPDRLRDFLLNRFLLNQMRQ